MQILSLNFLIYTLSGIWRPVEWSSNGAKLLYSIYTFIVVSSVYFMILTQIMDVLFVVDNINDFTNNTLMCLSVAAVCCKMTIAVVRRNAITTLIQILTTSPCKPRDEEEASIQAKFDKFIRSCLIKYIILCTSSCTGVTIGSVLNIIQGQMPYRMWLPFNYHAPLAFFTISVHQVITIIIATMINVGTDTLVFGLFLQTCSQLEIFENRLQKFIINKTVGYLGCRVASLNEEKLEISECIRHHLSIYKYAEMVNSTFNQVLFLQFFSSILVLCTSVYYLSLHIQELSTTASFLVYTFVMFLQIYIYCWSGNEVILKSMSIGDAIYCMDWPLLSVNEKKHLLLIMLRSTIPIKFTSSFLITASLQSYSSVSSPVVINNLEANGIWRPVEWSSNGAKLLYVFIADNVDDFANNTLICLSVFAICCKTTVIVVRRNGIIALLQILMKTPCKPRDEDEAEIQMKFDVFIRRNTNMKILTLNFLISNLCGIWRPIEWSSNVAKLLYNIFTFIVIASEYFVMLTQFMDIILIVDNINDFATNTLMFLTIVAVCCKATVVVARRNAIINLVQTLLKAPCKPRDKDETTIQTKFDKFIRSCSIKYLLLVTSSVTGNTIGSVLNVMHGHLPYRTWLPFNCDVPMVFWTISIHQIITVIFAAVINLGTDTLVFGLFLQTCAQLEIFENRIRKLIISKTFRYLGHALSSSNEAKTGISECIRQHLSIYKWVTYAKMVNVIFNQVLFVQFFGSILILCTSVYYMSIHIVELSGTVTFLVYTIGMFIQIYVYCWSGNEVILKQSANVGSAIYCMDWPLLSVNERKELLIIMIRSTIPIKFTSSFLITLSLQSFSNILRTSYSAFNVLQK
ncbi:PREDICTED: uncharacterized protein LOC105562703 [Vollenhovia emeryi]|uniref:uncharacterized protein LOC105562703 n=1 Tax=Vollenhovia emeryi TaxID=411798 RepID=UPI0005F4F44F|nr:PREDICTED: uncharacterized protein LOC105562703 [Vollenhovia emeryi]